MLSAVFKCGYGPRYTKLTRNKIRMWSSSFISSWRVIGIAETVCSNWIYNELWKPVRGIANGHRETSTTCIMVQAFWGLCEMEYIHSRQLLKFLHFSGNGCTNYQKIRTRNHFHCVEYNLCVLTHTHGTSSINLENLYICVYLYI